MRRLENASIDDRGNSMDAAGEAGLAQLATGRHVGGRARRWAVYTRVRRSLQ